MTGTMIIWKEGDGWQRRLSKLAGRLSALFERAAGARAVAVFGYDDFMSATSLKGAEAMVVIPPIHAFQDRFDGRTKNYNDLQNILANQIDQLSPLSGDDVVVLADRGHGSGAFIDLLFLRQEFVAAIEDKAGQLGLQKLWLSPETAPEVRHLSPTSQKQVRVATGFWVGAFALLAVSLWLASGLAVMRAETMLAETKAIEAEWRSAAQVLSEQNQQVSALQSLAENGVDRQTVAGRLDALVALRDATPDQAWWLDVTFSGNEIAFSGLATNAPRVLQSIAAAYPERSVTFSEPIIDEGGGRQSFVLAIGESK